jgi:DNA polymerase I
MNTGLINTDSTSIYTPKYTLVSNLSTLNSALQGLFQAEVLAIDCETTGLDPLTDSIRLIQIAAPNHPVLL